MKKFLSALCIIIVIGMLSCALGTLSVFAEEPEYEKREITTYVFSLENVKTTECVFSGVLPEVPYIDPVDYLSAVFTNEFSQCKNDDGTYSVKIENGTMTLDTVKDTVYFDNFNSFFSLDANMEGSDVNIGFIESVSDSFLKGPGPLMLDLGKYGIDVIEYDGRAYLPLTTVCVVFSSTYSNAEYVDGNIYFLHSMDNLDSDGYFDKSSVYETVTRSEEMAAFTYANICFAIDCFYGKPTNAKIALDIAEKGFDKTLQESSDFTRTIREKLLSADVCDYMTALVGLTEYFDDGGHTVLFADSMGESAHYKESAFFTEFSARYKSDDPFYAKAAESYKTFANRSNEKKRFSATRAEAYSKYEKAISWDETTYLLISNDTAVFVFDSFTLDTHKQFREALLYAQENGIKNFVIDVSGNGGGYVAIAFFMEVSMTSKKNNSNEFKNYGVNVTTGDIRESVARYDLNLDGKIDEDDKSVSYDMNFAVLTSKNSFSSGNLLPVLAKEDGIAVIGEVSGGGACAIQKLYFADAHFIYMSSNSKFYVSSGADVDLGAPVDYDLTKKNEDGTTDYSGMFDIDVLGKLIEEFYTSKEQATDETESEELISEEESEEETEEAASEEETEADTAEEEAEETPAETDPQIISPETGDNFGRYMIISFAAMAVCITVVILLRKKSRA